MIYALLTFILLTSCSLFQSKAPDQTHLFLKENNSDPISHYTIKKILTRKTTMAGGDYQIQAYPFTPPLIQAMSNDLKNERDLSKKNKIILENKLAENYLNNKTCFHLNTSVLRFEKASELKNWKVVFIDENKKQHLTYWSETNPTIKSSQQKSTDKLIRWLNEGTVCTEYPVELGNYFSLKVMATYSPFPFSATSMLYWEVIPSGKGSNVNTVLKKHIKKRRSYKTYRGW